MMNLSDVTGYFYLEIVMFIFKALRKLYNLEIATLYARFNLCKIKFDTRLEYLILLYLHISQRERGM